MLQIPAVTSHMGCIGKDKFEEEMKKKSKLAGVNPIVDIKTVLSQLMERWSNYAVSSSEVLSEFFQVKAFAKLSNAIGKNYRLPSMFLDKHMHGVAR
ncbi:uncharacterized protein LOC131233022 [Magnolia sinica]|uniref:uncharacterized protein LOC131233022 n=1 Tax=Magnolia sinica TaxID=86752 RepID=UPI00265A73C4|nr:uncharacterized protein LOC131233022 [Magnolia sinica]XP_058085568.1 uncharacterized protein LOC131233022 [Magnolia sinica]